MNIRNALNLSTVAVVLAGGTSLMAQVTTGALGGVVTDEAGNPIQGARVTLESPALFQSRTYNTDAQGQYRALLLPVGNYTVKVSAAGKLSKTASDVRVGLGTNLSMPFTLRAQKAAESATVEVVSNMAQESKSDDKVAVNYSAEQLFQLPVGVTFAGAMSLTPGISGYGAGAMVRGSQGNNVMYRIDGINVKDDAGGGSLYQPLQDSIEDIQVVLSALNARNGLVTGGQVNIVTKSGGNTFEGSIRQYMRRGSWAADKFMSGAKDNGNRRGQDLGKSTDITLSGPIIKDRLWFYVGAQIEPSAPVRKMISYQVSSAAPNPGTGTTIGFDTLRSQPGDPGYVGIGGSSPYTASYLPTVNRPFIAPMATYGLNQAVDQTIWAGPSGYHTTADDAGLIFQTQNKHSHIEAKFTGMVTDAHTLSFTYLLDKVENGGSGGEHSYDTWMMGRYDQLGALKVDTTGYTLTWNGTLASNWTIEARYSQADRKSHDIPNSRPGTSVMGYLASTDSGLQLHQLPSQGLSTGHDWVQWEDGYRWGTFNNRASTYYMPEKRGNQVFSANVKTFQSMAGEHEIDFGGEFVGTVYNFGRTKTGNNAIFQGGWYQQNGSTAYDSYLYPVFHRTPNPDGSLPGILDRNPNGLGGESTAWGGLLNGDMFSNNDKFTHWNDPMRGPSAHMERFWNSPKDSKNSTTSLWVNDIWTINTQWNVLVGLRYNMIKLNSAGNNLKDSTMLEPRVQVRYNPDGKNKEVYSVSIAKLSQAYSDQMGLALRGNEWATRSVHLWNGAAMVDANGSTGITAPGFDSAAAATDIPDSNGNNTYGYTYDGVTNMHGVRFVDYATLTNNGNYGPAFDFMDLTQSADVSKLTAPFTIEYNLGYQRNYDNGWFKMNLVKRTYKDDFCQGARGYGIEYLTRVRNLEPGTDQHNWKGTLYYFNSANDKDYLGAEISFQKNLSSRVTLGGSYALAQKTGVNDQDYYNYQNLRLGTPTNLGVVNPNATNTGGTISSSLLTPQQAANAVGEGYIGKDNTTHLYVTYVHPVGKGNVAFSFKADSWMNDATRSVVAQTDYTTLDSWRWLNVNDPRFNGEKVMPIDDRSTDTAMNGGFGPGFQQHPVFSTYYGKMGDYKAGIDYWQAGIKINATIPLGVGKLQFLSVLSIDNIFNHTFQTGYYGFFTDYLPGSANGNNWQGAVAGRAAGRFNGSTNYGAPNNYYGNAYNGANDFGGERTIGEFSIGLKF